MKTVELHNAWTWDCEECGALNFSRSITHEVTDEEREEIESRGVDSDGVFLTRPNVVVCSACKEKFNAKCHDEDE